MVDGNGPAITHARHRHMVPGKRTREVVDYITPPGDILHLPMTDWGTPLQGRREYASLPAPTVRVTCQVNACMRR